MHTITEYSIVFEDLDTSTRGDTAVEGASAELIDSQVEPGDSRRKTAENSARDLAVRVRADGLRREWVGENCLPWLSQIDSISHGQNSHLCEHSFARTVRPLF